MCVCSSSMMLQKRNNTLTATDIIQCLTISLFETYVTFFSSSFYREEHISHSLDLQGHGFPRVSYVPLFLPS